MKSSLRSLSIRSKAQQLTRLVFPRHPPPVRSTPTISTLVPAKDPSTTHSLPESHKEGLRAPSPAIVGVIRNNLSKGPNGVPAVLHLRSGLGHTTVALLCVFLALTAVTFVSAERGTASDAEEVPVQLTSRDEAMPAEVLPGRPGNLTPEQEEKLRKLWQAIFNLCGPSAAGTDAAEVAEHHPDKVEEEDASKKKRFGFFRKGPAPAAKDVEDDKYGQTKHFHEILADSKPEDIRDTIWTMVKGDHPDALALRFLRARKWDVNKALVMLVSTMSWRHSEMHLDDDIMKNGEGKAVDDEKNGEGDVKKVGHDFLAQIRMGKSFLHGTDKNGRPICLTRVRLHRQGDQCEESLERYTVYLIETARMVLEPPADTATIVFDLTGFTMANMDYSPVKFMIKCFEANYPESLGAVLVHNSPWVFQGIWKIIRGWLDPVVAGKVHFTNSRSDLEQFIEPSRLLKELGGDEDWDYEYVEPVPGENDKMKDTETRDRLLKEREQLVQEFEKATSEWILHPGGEEGEKIKARRSDLAKQLREGYWVLDPYIRARSLYDRTGAILPGGKIDWYSSSTKDPKPAAEREVAAETSADDVD